MSNTIIGINQKNHSTTGHHCPEGQDEGLVLILRIVCRAFVRAAKMKVTITFGLPCAPANTHQCNVVVYVQK